LGGTRLGGSSKVVMLLDPHDPGTDLMDQVGQACATLAKTGARVLLVVQDSAERIMQHYGPYLSRGRMHLGGDEGTKAAKPGIQVVVITPQLAQAILDHGRLTLKKAYKTALKKRVIVDVPVRFTYASRSGMLSAENVLGYVEGSDRKGEVVAVTAHYDHIGVIDGEVYNGADDDGSGTAAVLAMAEAFAKAKAEGHGPRRSMLFMAVSGEEKGLLGSDWYTQHPVFPLDSTVADLNIDMIGRTDTVYGDSSHYVYVIGSKRISKQLGELVEKENNTWTHLHLDYTFDAANDPNRFYYRSDHYNFAKHGVPIAFFFNGVHADYHGPKDEVDKIRFDLLRQRTLLVFHTAWVLANSEARLAKDGPEGVK
jgi:Zn-dependent M28 family amino/carboxypeptidase